MLFGAPCVSYALQRWPRTRRPSSIIGLALVILALGMSSFADTVWQLIVTQGVLYGIGGSLLYNPMLFYLDEWFIRRKGLAFGVLWAGTGTGGVIMPAIMSWGLEEFGFRTTLRVWAAIMVLSSLYTQRAPC